MFENMRIAPLLAASVWCGSLLLACGDSGSTPSGVTAGTGAGAPTAGATAGSPAAGSGGAGSGATGAAGRSGAAGATGAAGGAGAPAAGSGGGEDDAGMPPDVGQPTAGTMAPPTAGSTAPTAGSSAPDAGGPDATVMEPEPREDLGEGDGSDVITMGDSWMSNTLGTGDAIQGALRRLTSQPYRNYAAQGVLLLQSGIFGAAIPTQYQSAKRRDPDIKTVIMTGGGNDIIQNASVQASCDSGGEACKMKLAEIQAALAALWTEMANDGVKDVVYIQYSRDAGSTDQDVRDDDRPPPEICVSGKIRCHSIATTEAVMGSLQDGIHPTRAANDRIAKVVWDYMVAKGIRR